MSLKGTVIRSTGSWYQVQMEDNQIKDCRIKGKFRLQNLKTTNPVAVGDRVTIVKTEGGDYIIDSIEERRNYIIRQSPKRKNARHIIAANLDQAVLMATYALPRTSTGFIDRFLLTAAAYAIPVVIVFNKVDLLDESQTEAMQCIADSYRKIGYKVVCSSLVRAGGQEEFNALLQSKVSLIAGHSGVGKSTLLNYLNANLELRTGDISAYHRKGKHTTTFAEMVQINESSYVIDTPGIKEFGVLDFEPQEVGQYFKEFVEHLPFCSFNDCLHVEEPKCAVVEAVIEEEIEEFRYSNYLNILADVQQAKKNL